ARTTWFLRDAGRIAKNAPRPPIQQLAAADQYLSGDLTATALVSPPIMPTHLAWDNAKFLATITSDGSRKSFAAVAQSRTSKMGHYAAWSSVRRIESRDPLTQL
ncbi:MAG: hypothetical protein ACRECN_04735, partial [Methylocella sp.]